MGIVCNYCKTSFSTESNLRHHQAHALYCLKLRNKEKQSFICSYCKHQFSTKYNLTAHLKTCPDRNLEESKKEYKTEIKSLKKKHKSLKKKYEEKEKDLKDLTKENNSLKEELDKYKGMVEGMKAAPDKRTIYNTNTAYVHPKLVNLPIDNVPALTDEYVTKRAKDGILTYEKAARGYRGMLDVICELVTHENDEGVTERNFVCTDVSRNSFHRLLKSKEWKADKGGRYLNNMLETFRYTMEEYKEKAYDIYKNTPHDSMDWGQADWERKNIFKLYGGVVCKEGVEDRNELVNALRKEIAKRASV